MADRSTKLPTSRQGALAAARKAARIAKDTAKTAKDRTREFKDLLKEAKNISKQAQKKLRAALQVLQAAHAGRNSAASKKAAVAPPSRRKKTKKPTVPTSRGVKLSVSAPNRPSERVVRAARHKSLLRPIPAPPLPKGVKEIEVPETPKGGGDEPST